MTRKTGWEKPTNGPDWIDVMSLMSAISALHSGHVEVKEYLVGVGFDTTVMVQACMFFDILPGSQLPKTVKVESEFPSPEYATFAAHVFNLLYQLDFQIGKAYQQEKLWK